MSTTPKEALFAVQLLAGVRSALLSLVHMRLRAHDSPFRVADDSFVQHQARADRMRDALPYLIAVQLPNGDTHCITSQDISLVPVLLRDLLTKFERGEHTEIAIEAGK